jgi:MarR family transcriptional repressor of emrRAB
MTHAYTPPSIHEEDPNQARTANLMAATARLVDDVVQHSLRRELRHGASAPAALISVANQPGLSIERLSRFLGISHSGTVRLVDRLEADALLTRQRAGGRDVQLFLTASGRRMVGRLETARLEAVGALLASLGEDARAALDDLLGALLASQAHSDEDLYRICRLCSFAACQSERPCPVDLAVSRRGAA